ncbi:MAG TPA: V-type ATP synthase subunit D, partial [Caldilineaceae bacterium]|nr:V-type ATP synthase subunit D [Caldilineaceae bacterium]
EVIVHELLQMLDDAERSVHEAETRFHVAYEALLEARMRMGAERLHWASLAPAAAITTEIGLRSIMGVAVPLVQWEVTPLPLAYGLSDTSAALDEARARWLDVAERLGHLAETTTTVWRLATELQKTQRRVNALDHVLIPQLEAEIAQITNVLEEHEREAFVRGKRVKALQEETHE